MNTDSRLAAMRKHSHSLGRLPDSIRIPPLAGRRDETIRPIEAATLDDVAFALLALQEKSFALYGEIEALRTAYDMARRNGAVGADLALHAIPLEKESR